MDTKIEKQENNTYKVHVTATSKEVDAAFAHALKHEAENAEIKGFRKGKAPLNVVKDNVDQANLRGHALNHLISDLYSRIIKENHLKPILQPRFEILEFEEGKDLDANIIIIEKPDIVLKDYKKALADTYKKTNQGKSDDKQRLTNEQVIEVILQNAEIGIPQQLIEEETNRMMSSLIDQTAKLGMTIEQYLTTYNKTPEDLRTEYAQSAEKTLKADFLITEIALTEKITISDEEIAKTIQAVPDEASREQLQKPEQQMYIKAVLLKSKTLETLAKEAEGDSTDTKEKPEKKKEERPSDVQEKESDRRSTKTYSSEKDKK